ncbi:Isoflavone reductase IRL, partial [Madurella mycetomatis]
TVAVLGGSGNLGPSIVGELVSAGFSVTGVTREASTNSTPKYPDSLDVRKVDFSSFDSLKAAFDGQDAVVSVVGAPGISAQKVAVDAAIAAGVKRFIPSEFGVNTRKVRDTPMGKILASKIAIVDYLQETVKENPAFTWTGLSTGLFFDWGLEWSGLGTINLKEKKATVVDSGNEKWQASTLAHIGKAVVGILKHPDETSNKYLATASFNLSQNELIAIVEELTGSKFAVAHEKSADLQKAGEEKLALGDYRAFIDFLRVHNSADGAGNALKEEDAANKLIGLPYENLKAVVEKWLKKEGVL